ncbi:FUSC family protein [Pedobacter mucosus]|uniref:FUSC family protein n=1 Tax=Pedobacter mucosus TaxID=2895286 RepID=UPI001EE4AD27|nr:FUSC family membrane protein [Pedobacter mucosus]UKT64987.1 FUSC family protein [Pedobacter mucosus]
MIKKIKPEIIPVSYFLSGEYFSDAVRNTISAVLPVLIFIKIGNPEAAVASGLGVVLICLTDLPDNRPNKIKTAAWSIFFFVLTALLVSLSRLHPVLNAIVLCSLAFIFCLLAVLGNRMAVIGMTSLVLAVFVLGFDPQSPLHFSLYILLGSIWYYSVSLIQIIILPYRSINYAINECLISNAHLLRSKAKNYNTQVPFDAGQKESLMLHFKVIRKHEQIGNMLSTDKFAMNPKNLQGRKLLGKARLVTDLCNLIGAVHYDYPFVRNMLKNHHGQGLIPELVDILSYRTERLVLGISTRDAQETEKSYLEKTDQLQRTLVKATDLQKIVLNKLLSNIIDINAIVSLIREGRYDQQTKARLSYRSLPTERQFSLKYSFALASPIIRFSLRLAASFLVVFIVSWYLHPAKYIYWIFLTLVIVARASFAITIKRTLQRIKGTLPGVILGLALILIIKNSMVHMGISMALLLGFYTFNRLNYTISVMFITPAVILVLGMYSGGIEQIILGRVIYTVIGCFVSLLASYFLPVWDSDQIGSRLEDAIAASRSYLKICTASHIAECEQSFRYTGKNAHSSLADLSDAIESAVREPVQRNVDFNALYAMQTLLYEINASITSIYLHREKVPQASEITGIGYTDLYPAGFIGGKAMRLTCPKKPGPRCPKDLWLLEAQRMLNQKLGYLHLLYSRFPC